MEDYIYIYIKKIEKQSITNVMNLLILIESKLKRFGFIKYLSGFYDGEKANKKPFYMKRVIRADMIL